jgi:hypothetical protein
MKNSGQQLGTQIQPPKFLMSSNVNTATNNSNPIVHNNFSSKGLLPLTTNPLAPTQQHIQPPQSPTSSQYSSSDANDLPCVYAIEKRPPVMFHGNTSPPESICSRMSDSSIPSLIRQDIATNKNLFQTIMNTNNHPVISNNNNSGSFKALFNKLNNGSLNNSNSYSKTVNMNGVNGYLPILQVSSKSNKLENEDHQDEHEEEEPKNFLNEEEQYDNYSANGTPTLNYNSCMANNRPLFMVSNSFGNNPPTYAFINSKFCLLLHSKELIRFLDF